MGESWINYTNLLQYTFVLQVVTMLVYSPIEKSKHLAQVKMIGYNSDKAEVVAA